MNERMRMRIAVSADGPDLDARVGYRFGTSPYVIILDPTTMIFEAVPNPGAAGGRGAGMQATALAIGKEVDAVITGYCSPLAEKYLAGHGIVTLTGVDNTVRNAAQNYLEKRAKSDDGGVAPPRRHFVHTPAGAALIQATRGAARQFARLLPVLVGVVFLMGLFNTFVSRALLSTVFSGNVVMDALWGACIGSIVAGNPINSYIIGGELLAYGVSLYAVTALIIAWVNVGLVQLPAEIAALGRRFALMRTTASFFAAITIATITVTIFNAVAGASG